MTALENWKELTIELMKCTSCSTWIIGGIVGTKDIKPITGVTLPEEVLKTEERLDQRLLILNARLMKIGSINTAQFTFKEKTRSQRSLKLLEKMTQIMFSLELLTSTTRDILDQAITQRESPQV